MNTVQIRSYERRWQNSGVQKYISTLPQRIDSLIERVSVRCDEYTDEGEFKESIAMESFTITEMLAQFASGGVSWIQTDKARFLSPTVDLLSILKSRSEHVFYSPYKNSIVSGNYDFLQASEHNLGWFESLQFPTDEISYLIWSSHKALSLLNSRERIEGFTPISLRNNSVLETFCRCESPIESILFMQLIVDGLLPPLIEAQWNTGKYRLDFALPEQRIAIECDGLKFHDTQKDEIRDQVLRDEGWIIFRFKGKDIIDDPSWCSNEIHEEFAWRKQI